MKKLVISVLAVALLLVAGAAGYGYWLAKRQGVPEDFWATYAGAKVRWDQNHVPTIEAKDWLSVVRAQGFVVASERMWQMDLIRRKTGGRHAEWFGEIAEPHDEGVQLEDREAVVEKAAAALPPAERQACDAYAAGVNDFIKQFPHRWSIEYELMHTHPEPWKCSDSMLVVLELTDFLSSTADRDAKESVWRRNLSQAWQNFLFTYDHPWNKPYFDGPHSPGPVFPPQSEWLPKRPIDKAKEARADYKVGAIIGSNNWAWRGPTGAFLANDPHMGYGVPQVWFAQRLRVAADDWVVGVAVPGLPGIVLGMNPYLAWAFTNTGEDVDDYLLETVSPDGKSYAVKTPDGKTEWKPIIEKTFTIKVKGQAPRKVTGRFTEHGPLAKRPHLGSGLYSRQWLPLKPGRLRLPSLKFAQAKTIDQFDAAVDSFTAPSQNVVFMDDKGNMGYRMSGTGVVRRVTGKVPQPADVGAWLGFEPMAKRHRMLFKDEGTTPRYIATANERLWVDPFGGCWMSDDREERIQRYLGGRTDFRREDMEALQMDTQSRFRQLLLTWVADHAGAAEGPAGDRALRWRAWDGSSRSNPQAFTDTTIAEDALTKLLIARVQATFKNEADKQVPYEYFLRRAWITAVLEAPGDTGVAPFGLGAAETARFVMDRVLAEAPKTPLHQIANRWQAQHPFVGRVPVIGDFFKVKEEPQYGSFDLVLAEQPRFGPSMRLVWDLSDPAHSTWSFPVGESGHVFSPAFKNWHEHWDDGQRMQVFDDGLVWDFPGSRGAPWAKASGH